MFTRSVSGQQSASFLSTYFFIIIIIRWLRDSSDQVCGVVPIIPFGCANQKFISLFSCFWKLCGYSSRIWRKQIDPLLLQRKNNTNNYYHVSGASLFTSSGQSIILCSPLTLQPNLPDVTKFQIYLHVTCAGIPFLCLLFPKQKAHLVTIPRVEVMPYI